MTQHYFDVAGLSKSFGTTQVLRDITISFDRCEFITLLGASGSGKTTLLQIFAGFVSATSGQVHVDGTNLLSLPAHRRDIGVVFQNYALFPHMSVLDNVAYPLKLRGVDTATRRRRAEAALDMVRLGGHGGKKIGQLSGGQQQRVALARAIVFEPRILLMDEAMSALDKKLREAMQIELRRLHDALGTTTIFVTHDQREAMTMSDRVAVLHDGRLAQFAPPREVYDHPASRYVAEFIGETTLLPIDSGRGGSFSLFGSPLHVDRVHASGEKALLSIRPEKVQLLDGRPQGDERLNVIQATVTDAIFQGESVLVMTRTADGGELSVRMAMQGERAALPNQGQAITLGIAACDAVILDA